MILKSIKKEYFNYKELTMIDIKTHAVAHSLKEMLWFEIYVKG